MMMLHLVDEFLKRALGGAPLNNRNRDEWDKGCKEMFDIIGPIAGLTWHDVHFPFGLSMDCAPIHARSRKGLMAVRWDPLDEYRLLFAEAEKDLPVKFDQQTRGAITSTLIDDAASTWYLHQEELVRLRRQGFPRSEETATAIKTARDGANSANSKRQAYEDLVNLTSTWEIHKIFVELGIPSRRSKLRGNRAKFAEQFLDAIMAPYRAADKEYGRVNNVTWESEFRRKMAFLHPDWRVFLPEQFLTLGKATPDLHQVAEMLVRVYKAALRRWTTSRPPGAAELLLARSYDEELHAHCVRRNTEDGATKQDKESIIGSIRRTYITCQVVAEAHGVSFRPMLAPGDTGRGGHATRFQQADFYANGSAGQWSGDWS